MPQLRLAERQQKVPIDPRGAEFIRGPMPHQLTGRVFRIEMDRGIAPSPFFLESKL
jgi:hypothetical protein